MVKMDSSSYYLTAYYLTAFYARAIPDPTSLMRHATVQAEVRLAVVFIAQATLQQWADRGKVRLDETTLLLVKEQRQVALRPAVRFTHVLGSDNDPNGLVGKVKATEQLVELGAEHYMDSVLLGEVAYTVVEGFLGDLMESTPIGVPPAAAPLALSGAHPAKQAASAGAADASPSLKGGATTSKTDHPVVAADDDAALLSQLFLDTVR